MTADLFTKSREWTHAALMSIYVLYPNKQDRFTSLKRIREALDRICDGEIDNKPRTQQQAIDFLRKKTEEARKAFIGREKKWVPHSATFYNQSKYLMPRVTNDEVLPAQLEACVAILAAYPKTPGQPTIRANIQSFLPALSAIDAALKNISVEDLLKRVKLYRSCVDEWPKEELRYVPNPAKWFTESRWNQDESLWRRQYQAPAYANEREQIARLIGQKR
jgi:hypothetical protein